MSRPRPLRTATVASVDWLSASMVRLSMLVDNPDGMPELPFSDHYIKLLFAPRGADYRWPFDPDEIRTTHPRDQWPVTRTYTIRSFEPACGRMEVDFVVHGDEGLAGPWAADARPGDRIGFHGPGGAWAPPQDAGTVLMVGDEAAIPAIAAAMERLTPTAHAEVFIEVDGTDHWVRLPEVASGRVHWIHRARPGHHHGHALVAAVTAAAPALGASDAFVHGNADMVRALHRLLRGDLGMDRARTSISGYWRTHQTEDQWQATKHELNADMAADLVTVSA